MSKRVVFIADTLDNAYKFQRVLAQAGADVAAGSTLQLRKLLQPGFNTKLVVFEGYGAAQAYLDEVISQAENSACPLLVIVDADSLRQLRLPALVSSDFVMRDAVREECLTRVRRLLGETGSAARPNVITMGPLSINLDTYQVTVADEPIDFTYLEYALLAFLARHPNRTFSRELLLQNVWGFDYYGGSRTVDVHVRRIRAKLGPEVSQRLETIRGVGYLWNSN